MTRKKQPEAEREWTGVFAAPSPASWVARELEMEKLPDDTFAPPSAQPVSVRIEVETLAMLDAFAQRFRQSRSGLMLELIRGGLAEAFRALPDDEKAKIAEAVQAKAPRAGGFNLPPQFRPFTAAERRERGIE
jgi:hypothetical protein